MRVEGWSAAGTKDVCVHVCVHVRLCIYDKEQMNRVELEVSQSPQNKTGPAWIPSVKQENQNFLSLQEQITAY